MQSCDFEDTSLSQHVERLLVSARVCLRLCILEMCDEMQVLQSSSHALVSVRIDIVLLILPEKVE